MNKKLLLIIFIMTLLTGCGVDASITTLKETTDSTKMEIHFLDVGQADCILIKNEDKTMLIDAGNNGDWTTIDNYLKKENITSVDVAIATHPHEDHIGSLDEVIKNYNIKKVYMPEVTTTTKTFKDVISAIESKGLKITTPVPGKSFKLGSATVKILAPNGKKYDDLNNYSIVLKVTHGKNKMLFTGDAEAESEEEMLEQNYDLSADLLKVGHHGSNSSTSNSFLEKVNPEHAIISVGEGNKYRHPADETLDKLKDVNIYRTDLDGTIVATSNGNTITIDKQRK